MSRFRLSRAILSSECGSALAYYHSHRAEIDADIEADERFVAEMKAKAGPSQLQQKLAALGMTRTIRFHLDENCDPAPARRLQV